jgi:pimeloyl-ACP methyl ester carboxylesterase
MEVRAIESFFVGGRSVALSGLPMQEWRIAGRAPFTIDPDGDAVTGQMYVQAFRLQAPRQTLPVLLWHGGGLTGACWESTPDGRPGWLTWFLRQGFDVLVSDAMERGRASWSPWPQIYATPPFFRTMREAWETFRIGPPGSWHADPGHRNAHAPMRFPLDAFDAFACQFVPRWAGHDAAIAAAYDALLDRVGPCIVVAHSQGGGFAFQAAQRRPDIVRAVVALEPSDAPDVPPRSGRGAPPPHLIVWGDNVASHPSWQRYRAIVDAHAVRLAAAGAAIRVVDLPALGIRGNSHMLMMDDNSDAIAALAADWLCEQSLAAARAPNTDPQAT